MNIRWHMPVLRRDTCGLSNRAVRLAECLVAAGHTVRFSVDAAKTDVDGPALRGLPVDRLPAVVIPSIHWSLQSRARRVAARQAAAQLAPARDPLDHDLLISCQPEFVSAYDRHTPRRPLIFVCGGTTLLHDDANIAQERKQPAHSRLMFALDRRLKHRAEREAFHRADAVVFNSKATRDLVIGRYAVPPTRCHVIYGGVEANACAPSMPEQRFDARCRLGIAPGAKVIVWSGRLSPEKNLDLLLRATARSHASPDHVLLLGDGPAEPVLRALAARLGVSGRVRFEGRQSDVRPFLEAAGVFAFPSIGESFGLAIIEAMACGLPVIALKPGGAVFTALEEIITHGETGLLVDPPTPDAFAAALDRLLTDAPLRVRLGNAAREIAAARFTWRSAGEQLLRLIDSLTAPRNSCPVPERAPVTAPA